MVSIQFMLTETLIGFALQGLKKVVIETHHQERAHIL